MNGVTRAVEHGPADGVAGTVPGETGGVMCRLLALALAFPLLQQTPAMGPDQPAKSVITWIGRRAERVRGNLASAQPDSR
jgi:hypothetical protein